MIWYVMAGMRMARLMARPKVTTTSDVSPDLAKAKPPLSPKAIKRYRERKREI